MDEPQPPGSGLQKLVGGVELEVRYADAHTERLKVRYLPMRQMQRYLEVFNDEAASVELFCDKEKGWADTLTPESFEAIAEKGQELNLPLFRNWYRRLQARSEAMNPGLVEKVTRAALESVKAKQAADSASTSSAQP